MSRQPLSLANTQCTWKQTSESNNVQNWAGGTFRGMLDTLRRLQRHLEVRVAQGLLLQGCTDSSALPVGVHSWAQADTLKAVPMVPVSSHTSTAMPRAAELPLCPHTPGVPMGHCPMSPQCWLGRAALHRAVPWSTQHPQLSGLLHGYLSYYGNPSGGHSLVLSGKQAENHFSLKHSSSASPAQSWEEKVLYLPFSEGSSPSSSSLGSVIHTCRGSLTVSERANTTFVHENRPAPCPEFFQR